MARLNYIERELIEDIFQMHSGGVLDFSNRTFEEFINDVLGYNVYSSSDYIGLSKAKILRKIREKESDIYVGKLFVELINYMHHKNMVNSDNREKVDELQSIALRMLGKTSSTKCQSRASTPEQNTTTVNFDALKDKLIEIDKVGNAQRRGYLFEKYLSELFAAFNLNPRNSYKTEYDQIDGSFVLDNFTVLLEAKYRSEPPSKNDLILFQQKLGHMSNTTRGIFISLVPLGDPTIQYYMLQQKSFIAVSVDELYLMCERHIPLPDMLRAKFRKLSETGNIFVHLLTLNL